MKVERRNHNHRSGRRNPTRKEFLLSMAGAAALPQTAQAALPPSPRVLLVVAHPDDEYVFAATTYRIVRELQGTVDQVVITNGEGGFRYSLLAEAVYGLPLTDEKTGRSKLPEIRKEETLRAGKILGIRNHYFLNQRDARFTLDGREALSGIWDTDYIVTKVASLLETERYDAVFTLLPTLETHGHHQAATLLALEAAQRLPAGKRPIVFGSEPSADRDSVTKFAGRSDFALMRTKSETPVFQLDRGRSFGHAEALNYAIVVNWIIAEHKSQGLFQTECGKHRFENFWQFDNGASSEVVSGLVGSLRSNKAEER